MSAELADLSMPVKLTLIALGIALAPFMAASPAVSLKEINPPTAPPSKRALAILGATLIDGRGGPPVSNATVIVLAGKIIAAGPKESIHVPDSAETFNAAGLTLLPGFIDCHFHIERSYDLPRLFLSHGVTSLRDPGQWIEVYEPIRS